MRFLLSHRFYFLRVYQLQVTGLFFKMTKILFIAFIIVLLNLPFGFWRAGVEKFSVPWFLAVHIPVLFIIGIRFISGLGWQLMTFPFIIGSYFVGQFFGGKFLLLYKERK